MSFFVYGLLTGIVITLIIAVVLFKTFIKNQSSELVAINDQSKNALLNDSKEQLSLMLSPLKESLGEYQKAINSLNEKGIENTASLKTQLQHVMEQTQKVETEAHNLTRALKGDVKMQGDWGEMILSRIMELSGLEEGREYSTQHTFKNHEGNNFRPDLVIFLPEDGHIIVDSKVSLVTYEKYVNRTADESEEALLKAIKTSMKNHVDGLSEKNYQNLEGVKSPDFVLMFIPIEKVISILLNYDKDFLDYCFKKKVILTGPFGLMPVLRSVQSLWRINKQNENAEEIARKAGLLYDKFQTFYNDVDVISKELQKVQDQFLVAKKRVMDGKGNLLDRVEELKSLGAKTQK
jgi:DNA recombination protein RmuC